MLITGLEAHVCVLQTTLDLIEKGYDVHVLADCVSSQGKKDRKVAIEVCAKRVGREEGGVRREERKVSMSDPTAT